MEGVRISLVLSWTRSRSGRLHGATCRAVSPERVPVQGSGGQAGVHRKYSVFGKTDTT